MPLRVRAVLAKKRNQMDQNLSKTLVASAAVKAAGRELIGSALRRHRLVAFATSLILPLLRLFSRSWATPTEAGRILQRESHRSSAQERAFDRRLEAVERTVQAPRTHRTGSVKAARGRPPTRSTRTGRRTRCSRLSGKGGFHRG